MPMHSPPSNLFFSLSLSPLAQEGEEEIELYSKYFFFSSSKMIVLERTIVARWHHPFNSCAFFLKFIGWEVVGFTVLMFYLLIHKPLAWTLSSSPKEERCCVHRKVFVQKIEIEPVNRCHNLYVVTSYTKFWHFSLAWRMNGEGCSFHWRMDNVFSYVMFRL